MSAAAPREDVYEDRYDVYRMPSPLLRPEMEQPVRTNIVIDDKLMAATLKATGIKTKREAVEQGLRTLLRLKHQTELRKLRGKFEWEGDLDAMRRDK